MKRSIPALLSIFLFLIVQQLHAIHPNKVEQSDRIDGIEQLEVAGQKSMKDLDKEANRKARLEKRLQKFEQKLNKRMKRAESQVSNMWDDSRFKLGALLILGAIGLGILGALGILSGLFNFIAGLLALAGIILVIWALVDY